MPAKKASFVAPMLLLRTTELPEGDDWMYEVKLDGFRALAIKTSGSVQLRSRNNNDFNGRYPSIVQALANMPDDTVIDGEIVALDESGRPSFNALQNYGSSSAPLLFFAFDLLMLDGRNLMDEPLETRRQSLEHDVSLREPIRFSPELRATLADLVIAAREQGFEGLVAKRRNSRYEPGQRSGAWRKMRIDQGQEFVIGGYTPSASNFDALIIGYYDGSHLLYTARTRNGFAPASRQQLFRKLKPLETPDCPFDNLPEKKSGRWGQGLTAAKMKECRWIKPVLVGQFEFVEWTPDNHLRHSRFVGLREDKKPREVIRER